MRRMGDLSDVTELSISVPQKVYDDCVDALKWAEDTGRNELGTICALFRELRDNGYDLNNRSNER